MRIGYFADGPWSHLALENIVKDERFEIAFIVPRFDFQDQMLREWAERLNVDYLPIDNINQDVSIDKLAKYAADLFVSMSFNQIFRKEILDLPALGVINCHAGALPYYRGRNILNWALINDEKEFGVTVHYVDEGIDTGDIIVQNMSKITDQDTYATLLKRAIIICADSLFEALITISEKKVIRQQQQKIDSVGTYCGRRVPGDEWVDWNKSSREIFNLIRAITEPGPCAKTILNGQEVYIKSSQEIVGAHEYIGTPGEIVGVSNDGVIVKTGDSTLLLNGIIFTEDNVSLRVGQRLGVNLINTIVSMKKRIIELENLLSLSKI